MPDARPLPRKRWITFGVLIVALATVLVVMAVFFAASKSSAFARLRIAAAQQDAFRLRIEATEHIRNTAADLLRRTAEQVADGHADVVRRAGASWLSDLFIWNGDGLTHRPPTADAAPIESDLAELIESRLRFRFNQTGAPSDDALPFIKDVYRDESIVLIYHITPILGDRPILTAVRIDLERLIQDYLTPLFAKSGKLAITESVELKAYWVVPLSEALPLVIIPAPEFVESELAAVPVEVTVYAAMGVVFLLVLAGMVWKLVRLVQRELALTHLKSNFVADVSHELKTPLALISMFAEMLSEGRVPTEEKKREYYSIMTRESTRLTQLIDNILDFSKIDAGKKIYHMESVEIAQIVRGTYTTYSADLDLQGFKHSLSIADNLPTINADPNAIAQSLVNLMSNAVKYSAEDKIIEIDVQPETRRGKHGVLISVADTGIGITPEDRAHLFDGFFRATDDRVRSVRGTGLGLSVVQHIVDAHGGSIDVESRLVRGSVFRIFLPQSVPDADS